MTRNQRRRAIQRNRWYERLLAEYLIICRDDAPGLTPRQVMSLEPEILRHRSDVSWRVMFGDGALRNQPSLTGGFHL